jgi:hypothetical protein
MTLTTLYASVAIAHAGRAHITVLHAQATPDQEIVIHVRARGGSWLAYSTAPGTPAWPERQTFAEALEDALGYVTREAERWCRTGALPSGPLP